MRALTPVRRVAAVRRPVSPLAVEPAARRSLVRRALAGRLGRRVARADVAVFRVVRCAATPAVSAEVARFSALGEHAAVWLAIGAAGTAAAPDADKPRWRRAVRAVVAAFAVNTLVKQVARRKRPALAGLPQLVVTPTQLSFPSAHATTSFAAAAAYRGLLPTTPLYAAASAMALSRVYLGVHYPSDIAVGAALGTAIGSLAR